MKLIGWINADWKPVGKALENLCSRMLVHCSAIFWQATKWIPMGLK